MRFRDGGVHENSVGAELHRNGSVGCGADAGVHDHGNFGDAFAKDAEICGILNAKAGADRRGQRHDGSGTGINQFARSDQIVIRVRQNDEPFFYEDARGFDELLGVWK